MIICRYIYHLVQIATNTLCRYSRYPQSLPRPPYPQQQWGVVEVWVHGLMMIIVMYAACSVISPGETLPSRHYNIIISDIIIIRNNIHPKGRIIYFQMLHVDVHNFKYLTAQRFKTEFYAVEFAKYLLLHNSIHSHSLDI